MAKVIQFIFLIKDSLKEKVQMDEIQLNRYIKILENERFEISDEYKISMVMKVMFSTLLM